MTDAVAEKKYGEKTVKEWGFALTSVAWRKEDLKNRLARSARLVKGEEQIELNPTGEEGILLIKALCGLTRVVSNVNIPNTALQIPNLPADAVVETNALFGRDSIRPVYAGAMPDNVKELVMPHIRNHERILEAAKNRDAELVVRSFMEDPVVGGSRSSESEIRQLVSDMMSATL